VNKIFFILLMILLVSCSRKSAPLESRIIETDEEITYVKTDNETTNRDSEYFRENYLRFEDYVYNNSIKTILFHKEGWELATPIIQLHSDEKLELSFDDLETDVKNYRYTIIHCNALWKQSDLIQQEYILGFTEGIITDFAFSINTIQRYTHYYLKIPDETMKITKSGNYILKVYRDGDPDNPVFTRRFYVLDQKVSLEARIKRATAINDMNYKQEIDFLIRKNNYEIIDPYKDLKVIVKQNGRTDNTLTGLKPLLVKDDLLDYNFDRENVFNGGNEFRNFDIKSLKYQSSRVRRIGFDSVSFQITLFNDLRRPFQNYHSEEDINGMFVIKTEDRENSQLESEYVYVNFFLPYDAPLAYGNLYIMGTLTNWSFSRNNMMQYNYRRKGYEASLYLKQGYYNYQYVFLEDGSMKGDEAFIEGSHFETENDYTIFVYNKEPGELYDQLIGLKQMNSREEN